MYFKKLFQYSILIGVAFGPTFLLADDEPIFCEVLSTEFFGEKSIQVQCGEGPEGIGWISSSTKLQRVVMKLHDQKTGHHRMISLETFGEGGVLESLGFNHFGLVRNHFTDLPIDLPIGLYIPGGCGSNKIFHSVTFDVFKDEKSDTDFFKTDEECAWLNSNDTNWRKAVEEIKEDEEVVFVRYGITPNAEVYYDKNGEQFKGRISTFYKQASHDDLHCEALKEPFVLKSPDNVSVECRSQPSSELVQMCFGELAWCSSLSNREHFEFVDYGCKALEDGTCPSVKDCIFGENSFYASTDYRIRIPFSFDQRFFYNLEEYKDQSSPSSPGDR